MLAFSENLACFVFVLPPFRGWLFCLITDDLQNKQSQFMVPPAFPEIFVFRKLFIVLTTHFSKLHFWGCLTLDQIYYPTREIFPIRIQKLKDLRKN